MSSSEGRCSTELLGPVVSPEEFQGRGGIMAKSGQRSFMKRQKEIERKKKAEGKMARRQAKKKQATEGEKQDGTGRPEE